MKREAKLLLEKACDSLVLSIELFNRPYERGRVCGTLIQLHHGFEMLMKAAILHKGGRIRDRQTKEMISFSACVRRSLSDGAIKYLADEQALLLQAIRELRNAAQHYLLDISEAQLYIQVQSGVTLFRDILLSVFGQNLSSFLPARVLPVSTELPTDLVTLFDSEVSQVRKLLGPRRRRRIEAMARLRPLAILDAAFQGEMGHPSDQELVRLGEQLMAGQSWEIVFKGVAAVDTQAEGNGPSLSLRISKKEGIPVRYVPEGTPGASVVAVKRLNELSFYNLGAKELAAKLSLTIPKLINIVEHLGIRNDEDCYKEFKLSGLHKRYSQNAIKVIESALIKESADEMWAKRRGLRASS